MKSCPETFKKYVFLAFLIPCFTFAQEVAQPKPQMDEVAFERFLDKVYTDMGERTSVYESRIKKIQEQLDPKQKLVNLCHLEKPGKMKCDDFSPKTIITEFIAQHKDENLTQEKICHSLNVDIKWIQKFRQKGKPFYLFVEDSNKVNKPHPENIGAFPMYLVNYVFRVPVDTDSNMLGSDIELKCLKFKN